MYIGDGANGTPKLQRTCGTPEGTNALTISSWYKKGSPNTGSKTIFSCIRTGTAPYFYLEVLNDFPNEQNGLHWAGYNGSGFDWNEYWSSGMTINDWGAWYHWHLKISGTTTEIYLNGQLYKTTSFNTGYYPISGSKMQIGCNDSNQLASAAFADTYWIDGQALAPSAFGEVHEDTGQWVPKRYGGSFAGNSAFLNYSDSSDFGTDSSGLGNDFTATSIPVYQSKLDSPSNNFATLSPAEPKSATDITLSEGNLKGITSSGDAEARGTIALPQSGKWYWEFCMLHSTSFMIGVIDHQHLTGSLYGSNKAVLYSSGQGTNYNFSGVSSNNWGATWTTGDIMGVAFNRDDNQIIFYKNNSAQPTLTIGGTAAQRARLIPIIGTGTGGTAGGHLNFGQDSSFAGAKTAQGNKDTNGIGDFYYTPPTGHLALCTDNLPEPSIILPTEHFNTITYTGNGTSPQARTGLGHKPSFLWIKDRGAANNHVLTDSIRGPNGAGGTGQAGLLYSNVASAEVTGASQVKSYDTDGFTTHSTTYVNENTNTYVAWGWKGSDTPTKTFAVTVTNPGSGNRYTLDGKVSGTNAMPITIEEGGTYTFDQSDNTNSGHPLRFSTTSDGTHGGGSEYTTGVTVSGTPGSAGAKTVITVAASAATLYFYCTAHSGMGAQASTPGSGGGVSDLSGTIASVVNANTTAGFSIATYTGNGTSGATFGHGLSVAPEMVWVKSRSQGSSEASASWVIYSEPVGNTKYLYLNTTGAETTDSGRWNDTTPSASVVTLGDDGIVNANTETFVSYCFHSVDGYSKVGSYEGNGARYGSFVYTGFRPAFIFIKRITNAGSNSYIADSERAPFNGYIYATDVGEMKYLWPDATTTESGGNSTKSMGMDILSTGFKFRTNSSDYNSSSNHYLFYAIAQRPFKYAEAR